MLPERIHNAGGERLAFSFEEGAPGRTDVVVLGHGLTSDKDRPWSEGLAHALSERGIASLRFAFSGNGESEGRFVDSNITKEVDDLGAVLDALEGRRISYVGHSMGGAVGLLRAVRDARIVNLVSLAAVTHAEEFMRRMFTGLQPGDPMLDKPHCPFSVALWDDLVGLGSLTAHAPSVAVPWLVVHGTRDEIVPAVHSTDLARAAGSGCELVLLEDVDHSFTGDGVEQVVARVVPWLAQRLSGAAT